MKVYFNQDKKTTAFADDILNLFYLAIEETHKPSEISVNLVDVTPNEIQEMNKTYRDTDRVTDVLSFPMIDDFNNIEKEPDYAFGECNIGDIYINVDRAESQAKEYGHSLRREYCFLALHGFLHLLGYDHIEKEQENEMFNMQDKILSKANIGRE